MKTFRFLSLLLAVSVTLVLAMGCNLLGPTSGNGSSGEPGGGGTAPTAVTLVGIEQTGGTDGVADTTSLTLTFDGDPTTLTEEHITVTGATKGALTGTGNNRSLAISTITLDNGETITVTVTSPSAYTISGSPQSAVVYRKNYALRDTGPAGGLIFHDKGSYSDGWRYLEAWTADESGTYKWKTTYTETGWTSDAIGAGYDNTYIYMSSAEHPAAEVARNANHGGFEDWFLPSKDELNQMYLNLHLHGLGGYSTQDFYWSSSESNKYYSWYQLFWTGVQTALSKGDLNVVRVVRAL